MVYGRKRLVSRAVKNLTAVSAAHLPKFPPPQATKSPRVTGFDPEAWGAVQPPPPSAFSAFAHRIGLGSVLTDTNLLMQACTHPSAQYLARQQDPDAPPLPTNAHLGALGNALMGLFATEYVHASYPYLPTRVLKAVVTAHVGPFTCSNVAQEMGAVPLLRWHRTVRVSVFFRFLLFRVMYSPQTSPRPTSRRYSAPTRSRLSPARSPPSSTSTAPFPPPANSSTLTSSPVRSTYAV